MKSIARSIAFSALICFASLAQAVCGDSDSYDDLACRRLAQTWAEGGHDFYLPLHTYHLPYAYTQEEIDSLRSQTWGLGYGRSRYDASGNWDGLYALLFLDSHTKLEPVVGYGHQWMWGPRDGLRAGLGYTAFVTARSDINTYTPIPAIMPIGSINYDRFSLNGVFIPGGAGFGNIAFIWSRFEF